MLLYILIIVCQSKLPPVGIIAGNDDTIGIAKGTHNLTAILTNRKHASTLVAFALQHGVN